MVQVKERKTVSSEGKSASVTAPLDPASPEKGQSTGTNKDAPKPAKTMPVFARHETFHPRFGWLKKGFDRASQNAQIFLQEDATVQLGVGKNMVRSIRYWASAFKILANDQPTEFGHQLLGPEGWDPYLEDPASLWLLHWKLLEQTEVSPCLATAWSYAFNQFRRSDFTQYDLFYDLCDYRDRISPRTADSSIKKDALCILKMYVEQPIKSLTNEDSLDCPFTELGLMHTVGDKHHYRFQIGLKPTLPPAIVAYACLSHYANQRFPGSTIPLSKLLYEPGSPGLVFKLTESSLCEALDQAGRQYGNLAIADGAGRLQFSFVGNPIVLANGILHQYYDQSCQATLLSQSFSSRQSVK